MTVYYIIKDGLMAMMPKKLDLTGKVSPNCLRVLAKEAKALKHSGELFITCDNFPAVTTLIPHAVREEDLSMEVRKTSDARWEIRLKKK